MLRTQVQMFSLTNLQSYFLHTQAYAHVEAFNNFLVYYLVVCLNLYDNKDEYET